MWFSTFTWFHMSSYFSPRPLPSLTPQPRPQPQCPVQNCSMWIHACLGMCYYASSTRFPGSFLENENLSHNVLCLVLKTNVPQMRNVIFGKLILGRGVAEKCRACKLVCLPVLHLAVGVFQNALPNKKRNITNDCTWYHVPSTWDQVPGVRYQVLGTRYLVPGTRY